MGTVGKNIKDCREKRHMTQEELASKMRVGPKRIEDYESGKEMPSNDTLLRISTVLDIPASELIGKPSKKVEQRA